VTIGAPADHRGTMRQDRLPLVHSEAESAEAGTFSDSAPGLTVQVGERAV
jgi:hypothetical protein